MMVSTYFKYKKSDQIISHIFPIKTCFNILRQNILHILRIQRETISMNLSKKDKPNQFFKEQVLVRPHRNWFCQSQTLWDFHQLYMFFWECVITELYIILSIIVNQIKF